MADLGAYPSDNSSKQSRRDTIESPSVTLHEMPPVPSTSALTPNPAPGRSTALILFGVYALFVIAVAFWPQPVDRGATGLINWVTTHFPLATYGRIEFTANVVFFIPLGALTSLVLGRRWHMWTPVIALATSALIETGQGLFLSARTADWSDIVANTIGGVIGWLVVVALSSQGSPASAPSKNSPK